MPRWRNSLRQVAGACAVAFTAALSPLHACPLEGAAPVGASLLRLTEHGDAMLDDRSIVRLAGIRMMLPMPGHPDPTVAALDELVRPWRNADTVLANPATRPDRWGRQLASIKRDMTGTDADLALALVRNGFAIVWASELPPNCRIPYLQAEDAARRSNLGRWTQMQHKVLDAANGTDVAARAGQVVVMSGRINHVGQTRRAAHLNFGARGTGASGELALATWRTLEGQGWTRDSMKGKIVRVRGVVLEGRPARLVVGDTAAIEFLN